MEKEVEVSRVVTNCPSGVEPERNENVETPIKRLVWNDL